MDSIEATCFFCGDSTKDAIDDGFAPDFYTQSPEGKYGGCHALPSCPSCSEVYLDDAGGDRMLIAPSNSTLENQPIREKLVDNSVGMVCILAMVYIICDSIVQCFV